MARFYGSIKGQARTEGTRRGSAKSGLGAHIRGWDFGVAVECVVEDGLDVIVVYRTGGSNNPNEREHMATLESGKHAKSSKVHE